MTDVTIGIIGGGLLGTAHALCLKGIGDSGLIDLDVRSVYDPDITKAENLVTYMGVDRIASSAREIMEDTRIDAVFIATPTAFHKDLVIEAARNNKHIFCEKPLYIDLEGACEMSRAVSDAGVTGGVGLVLRHSPTYSYMRSIIEESDTGSPILIAMRDDQVLPVRGVHDSRWRVETAVAGGGTVIEHSIHDLDILTSFFGAPHIDRALLRYRTGHRGIEDYARVNMRFQNGAEGVLMSIWHDMVTRVSNRRLEVVFERLFLGTDHDFIGPVEVTRGDDEKCFTGEREVLARFLDMQSFSDPKAKGFFEAQDYRSIGSYVMEDYRFLEAVCEKKPYSPGFEDAVAAHRLVDEIYKTAERIES
ncbi:MAG: Gfo/Idh/MocA family oxidoreductase [Deltaproteobacteria bacterium]|nr:Gfo/Idh/MocA family oxidoreductase [Candidatus Zymogenaceae bacterium]